jgi:hypothetical protein
MRRYLEQLLALVCVVISSCQLLQKPDYVTPETLLDLSGLAWVEGDLFLGVHDAKDNPEKHDWPRASFIRLPKSELEGLQWRTVDLDFPGPEGRGSDMESICHIPGGRGFLFCESGQEGEGDRRIFHVVRDGDGLVINSHMNWPVEIHNVEATEVCQVGDQLVFLYAERAESEPSTQLRWAPFSTDPLQIGEFRELTYSCEDPTGKGARSIVALDVDESGNLYTVAAYDSGLNDGGYRSVVWRIGSIDASGVVKLLDDPVRQGVIDGLKVESLAVRVEEDGTKRLYVGSDDEHFGGILRWIEARP